MASLTPEEKRKNPDFIREIIKTGLESGRIAGSIITRFPPEPNGYLHIGHAKSICLNFGIAQDFNGTCHLRFDDTNPEKEDVEYSDSIERDVRWLGFDWGTHKYYASDYYQAFYDYACELIKNGKAYVCDLTPDQLREQRGTPTQPGKESPYRSRSVEENMRLFQSMKNGDFKDGTCTVRAKIDMAHPNITMRDPALYRIKHVDHHRTKDAWCIYPMYDFAHCISDALEKITHSICTLEFEDHRPLYDWVLDNITIGRHPQQIEFARLNLTYTVMSKRKLLKLVDNKLVNGWDDPRMPTISGLRRRGYTPDAIRNFCDRIGVAKTNSVVGVELLEYFLREDLNRKARRVMAVLNPVKVIIDNYPEDQVEWFDAENNPEDPSAGTRKIPFSRVIYIERDDVMEQPPKGYFRLFPGNEVRLKHTYYITCTQVVTDPATGMISEVHCTYDPQSRGGQTPDNRRIKGTIHWVDAGHCIPAEVRLYDRLFTVPVPDEAPEGQSFIMHLNPQSLSAITTTMIEPSLKDAIKETSYQFMRQGYFCLDPDSSPQHLVFNRTITLKDSWTKQQNKPAPRKPT